MRERNVDSPKASSHPGIEQWIAYHGGELSETDEQRLRRHLTGCPECVSLVLDIGDFCGEEAAPRSADVSEFELAAAWRAMKTALSQEEPTEIPQGHSELSGPPAAKKSGRRGFAPVSIAASLLAGVLGLALWGAERRVAEDLRNEVLALRQPQINSVIEDLVPDTATRSGRVPQAIVIPSATVSTLVIPLVGYGTFAEYELEMLDASERMIWTSRGLLLNTDFDTLTLTLPAKFLSAGDYHLRLYGLEGEERMLLEGDLRIQARE